VKPTSTNYEILYWKENFGYSRAVLHASDVYEAVITWRKGIADKYGDIDGKVLIVKVEEKRK